MMKRILLIALFALLPVFASAITFLIWGEFPHKEHAVEEIQTSLVIANIMLPVYSVISFYATLNCRINIKNGYWLWLGQIKHAM